MHPFLQHRLEVAARLQGKLSQTRINTLQAQLDVRGKRGDYRLPSTMIVNVVKQYNASDAGKAHHAAAAKKSLDSYLTEPQTSTIEEEKDGAKIAKAVPWANDLNAELNSLARFITAMLPFASWIEGPLKTVPKAMGKTEKDYLYVYSNNKDLVRGTLACNSQSELLLIASFVVATCTKKEYAMSLMKNQEQKSKRDGGEMAAGYSGWNFVVDFKEHKFGAEVQANTYAMMYGKMSKAEFCQQLNVDVAQYEDRRRKAMFPGGLGHALYDIQDDRSKASKEDKDKARALALDYNDLCRGGDRKPSIQDMNNRIRSMSFNSAFAIEHWKEAVDGSGGLM